MTEDQRYTRFTLVFEGDIRAFSNPLTTETPFGTPLTASLGDACQQRDEWERLCDQGARDEMALEEKCRSWEEHVGEVISERDKARERAEWFKTTLSELCRKVDIGLHAEEADPEPPKPEQIVEYAYAARERGDEAEAEVERLKADNRQLRERCARLAAALNGEEA